MQVDGPPSHTIFVVGRDPTGAFGIWITRAAASGDSATVNDPDRQVQLADVSAHDLSVDPWQFVDYLPLFFGDVRGVGFVALCSCPRGGAEWR